MPCNKKPSSGVMKIGPKRGDYIAKRCDTLNNRVATAQGKWGIWLLTFPDRENTGNLVNLIFYTGKIIATQGKF